MNTYRVVVKPVELSHPGNLQFIFRIGFFDHVGLDSAGNEIYEVQVSDSDYVERQFNLNPNIISFAKLS